MSEIFILNKAKHILSEDIHKKCFYVTRKYIAKNELERIKTKKKIASADVDFHISLSILWGSDGAPEPQNKQC